MVLRNTPIKRKLIISMLITAGTVLLITFAAFLTLRIQDFRTEIVRDINLIGEILAINSTASLAFRDDQYAQKILSALEVESLIVAASIYDEAGNLFVSYPKDSAIPPLPPQKPGHHFAEGYVLVTVPVIQDNRILGYLNLQGDMSFMKESLQLYISVAAVILGISFLIALLLSNFLQRGISNPILALTSTARAVSENNDYSVRATRQGNDEIGLLTDSFNQMLEQIDRQNNILRESEERFRLLVDNVRDYEIIALDLDGNVASWNAGAERFKGYSSREILGNNFSIFYTAEDVAAGKPTEHLRTATENGRFEGTIQRVRKDGSHFWGNVTITQTLTDQGKLNGFSQITRDITERKQAKEQILQLNTDLEERVLARTAQLEEANRQLESFSYSVSHDLRAPLRHIQGFAEMLSDEAKDSLSDLAQRYLKTIKSSSVDMGQLIDDLLAFSRMGRTELVMKPVNLDDVITATIAGLEIATKDRDVSWKTHPLPEVIGDTAMIRQVFANLLENAVKYTREQENTEIEIGLAGERNGRIILFVRDNGAGFDMRYAKNLFGVFQRLHRADEFEGTGIGLASVRRIITRHDGEVWAESALNKGATFFFTLQPTLIS